LFHELFRGSNPFPRTFLLVIFKYVGDGISDVRREAIDIYEHIDKKELKESYLAYIPQLGI